MLAEFWSLICEEGSIKQAGLGTPGCTCRAPPGSRCHVVSQVLLKPLQPLKVQICFLLLCRLVSDSFSLESRDAQSCDLSPLPLMFLAPLSHFYRASLNMDLLMNWICNAFELEAFSKMQLFNLFLVDEYPWPLPLTRRS